MKFKLIFVINCILMGFAVGVLAALFLTVVNFLINTIWVSIPNLFHRPDYYPLIIGVIGGGSSAFFKVSLVATLELLMKRAMNLK